MKLKKLLKTLSKNEGIVIWEHKDNTKLSEQIIGITPVGLILNELPYMKLMNRKVKFIKSTALHPSDGDAPDSIIEITIEPESNRFE